jgi:hypothetical protein
MPGQGRPTEVVEREVAAELVGKVEGESGEAWRETSFNLSTFRVDGVNKLLIIYLRRHFETVRVEGQAEECEGKPYPSTSEAAAHRHYNCMAPQEPRSPCKDGDSL